MTIQQPAIAVILLGRGGYSSVPRQQLDRMVATLAASQRFCTVQHALVDHGDPALPSALDACSNAGANQIIVLPVFLPGDANLQTWLAKVARRWLARQPNPPIIIFADSLGDHPQLDTVIFAALEAATSKPQLNEHPPSDWEHNPAGWDRLPAHQHHLLICRGPRCNAMGAGACWATLTEGIKQLRGDTERVLVVQTNCLYPCNHGPVMVVYPDRVWYGDLTPERVNDIITKHLVNNQVVQPLEIIPGNLPSK
jgi:(2Fe-2S) ferredoxin